MSNVSQQAGDAERPKLEAGDDHYSTVRKSLDAQRLAPHQRRRRWLIRLGALLGIPLLLLLLIMVFEESLIFFPVKYPDGNWHPAGLTFEDAWFTAEDGTKIHGWYVPHPNPKAHVIYAHGNAGHLADRADILRQMHEEFQLAVLAFDYRGYGRSEGKPTVAGVLQDARAARRWLAEKAGIAESDVVLWGSSLGGGVLIDLAGKDGARGLIAECTFSSLSDVGTFHYPWLPVSLMRSRLDSADNIAGYHGPFLQSHGTADRVIPFSLGRKLFDAANEPKRFVELDGIGHYDGLSFEPKERSAIHEFLQRLPPLRSPSP